MRSSHFANFVVALTTFVATYQLFNGEQQLPTLPAYQLENIQASLRTKKSDRLALKEEEDQEEVEDQAFSPKPVRLEKYDLPTDDDLNSPKHLSYLAYYVYSEVPPDKKPTDTVLDSLKGIPVGAPIEEIKPSIGDLREYSDD